MKIVIPKILNVRDMPTIKGKILGQVNSGMRFAVREEKDGWYRISNKGWSHGAYFKDSPVIKIVEVTSSYLNIRKGPGLEREKVGQYETGAIVNVYELANDWYLTDEGWILSDYTRVYTPPVVSLPISGLSFPYVIKHVPFSRTHRPGADHNSFHFDFQGVTIHNTGNDSSTAMNERDWLANPDNERVASWHIAVDENMAVEAIPLNELAWHSGDYKGNCTTIGIEICEKNHDKSMANAIEIAAYILKAKGWGTDRLYTHQMWSGKYCPWIILRNNLWDDFITRVNKKMQGEI